MAPAVGQTPTTRPAVDPIADQILRQSCQFLAQSHLIGVHAEVWKDEVLPSGHKIHVTRSIELIVRRPDRFHLDARAHHKGRSIWYDGKTMTVLDRQKNLYAAGAAIAGSGSKRPGLLLPQLGGGDNLVLEPDVVFVAVEDALAAPAYRE